MDTQKQLDIIERMIQASRKTYQKSAFYFILWGLLMSAAALVEFYTASQGKVVWQIWPVVSLVGIIVSLIYGRNQKKNTGTTTSIDRISIYLWGAFGIALFITLLFCATNKLHPHAMVLVLSGLATFTSGGISKFKPLVIGGVALWIGSLLAIFIFNGLSISIIYAVSLFCGYVIPGFMLYKRENHEAR